MQVSNIRPRDPNTPVRSSSFAVLPASVRDENSHEIVEMLTAAFRKNRLFGRFDIRAIVEKIADQLVLINDERCRQIALAKAMFDAEIDALKREMASAKLDFEDFKAFSVKDNIVRLR